jgi:hypothetical protein
VLGVSVTIASALNHTEAKSCRGDISSPAQRVL